MIDLGEFKTVEIPLLNGGYAAIDIADAPKASRYRWVGQPNHSTDLIYARCNSHVDGKRPLLHRFLLEPKDNEQIDHRDRNGLNNRRSNLRLATHSQNGANRRVLSNNRLGVKGVRARRGRYEARIIVRRRYIYLGEYPTVEEAAGAYQKAAIEHFGEFAKWANQAK